MNWISVHVFHNYSFDKILLEHLLPLTNHLKENGYISSMFFIRYWEAGPHIRYRILLTDDTKVDFLKNLIIEKSKKYFISLEKHDLEYSFQFVNYIQELKRYGGEKVIKIAEKHFHDSSKSVLSILNDNSLDWNYSKAISFAIQMHVVFSKVLILNIEKAIVFFESLYKNWLFYSLKLNKDGKTTPEEIQKVMSFFQKSYEQQSETIDYLIKIIWQEKENQVWRNEWKQYCQELKTLINEPDNLKGINFSELKQFNKKSKLTSKDQNMHTLFDSYIHMSNNRLGIHLRDEAFIAYLIMNGLKKHFA
jgi:thiopeptide-type bacteriocin biosynthesis protein